MRDGLPKRRPAGGVRALLLDRTPAGRRLVYRAARAAVRKRSGGHYPAPLAALEAVRVGLEHGVAAGLAEEHHAFGQLAVSDVSRKLVQIFFATTALKKDDGIPPGTAVPRQIRRLGRRRRGVHGRGDRGDGGAQRRGGHPAQGCRPRQGRKGPESGRTGSWPTGSSAAASPARSTTASRDCSPAASTTPGSPGPTS